MSYTEDFLSALEEEKKKKKKKSSPVTQSKGRPSVRPSNKSYTEEFEETLQEQGLTLADFYNNRSSDIAPVRTDGVATPFGAGGALHKRFNTSANAEYYASQREDDGDDSLLDFFDAGALKSWGDGKVDWDDVSALPKAILGTAGDAVVGAAKGVFGFAEGIADTAGYGIYHLRKAFGETEADLADYKKAIAESTADKVFGGAEEYLDQYSVLGRTSNAITQGIGQAGAMIGTGGFLGGVAGLGTAGTSLATNGILGLSSFGSGMSEAYMGNATDDEAVKYGAMSAGAEIAFESLFGGVSKAINAVGFNKGLLPLDDMAAKAVSKFISSPTGKNVTEALVKGGFEGLEELGTGFAQAGAKKLTYMSEEDFGKILEDENLFEQFVVGMLTSDITQAGDVNNAIKTGRDFVTGNTQNEQAVIDKVVEDRIAEEEKNGKKLSGREKNKILEEVVRDMERGYIDTDTIEEVLGGDSYKSYQDTLAKEDAIKKEFEELKGKQDATLEEQARFREVRREYYRNQSNSQRTDLKNKLRDDVFNRVKNDRLVESYLEKARVGEDFQADLNKYKGTKHEDAAKKTIENAIKAGANNTNRVHDLVDMAADLSSETGYVYDFKDNEQIKNDFIERKTKEIAKLEAVENRTDAQNEKIAKLKDLVAKVQNNEVTVNGNVDPNGIVLNLDSAKPLNRIIGHEITHTVEKAKHYEKLRDSLFSYAKSKGVDIDAELEMKALEYEGVEGTTAEAELVADMVGDYLFTDSDFVKNLSTENRNLAQRIYDEIKYFLTKATQGSKEERELLRVKHEFEKAFRETASPQQTLSLKNYKFDKAVEFFADAETLRRNEVLQQFANGEERQKYRDSNLDAEQLSAIVKQKRGEVVEDIAPTKYSFSDQKTFLDWQIAHASNGLRILEENRDISKGWAKKKHTEISQELEDLLVQKYGVSERHKQLLDALHDKEEELDDAMFSENPNQAVIERLKQEYADADTALDVFAQKYLTGDAFDEPFAGAFDDAPWEMLSLSNKGEEFAPSRNDFYGKDFVKKSADDIAPVADTAVPSNETVDNVVDTVEDAPVAETADAESLAGDRDSFMSQQAMELYKEITSLKKGVRASKRLGYLLDHGYEWRSIKTALLNIRDNPNQVVNPNSAAESVAREMLGREYDDMVAELAEPSDVAGKIRNKMKHIQTEIANNERLREQSSMDYDSEIAEVQAEYDAKKNKNTLVANNLLRRIERLNRMKNTNDDRYAKRIGDLEARLEKMRQPTYKTAVQRKAKQDEYTNLIKNLVGDTTHWVDKKLGISYKVNTLRRNLRDVVRDANGNRDIAKADAIYDELQGKYNHNEAELKRESRRIKAVFADLKLNHAEDTYAHMLGEFRHNPNSKLTEEAVKEFYEANKDKIDTTKVDKAIEESRKTFDELLVRVNERLKEQGMKEIPYRQGYFPHFTNPKQGVLAKLFNWKTVDTEIPTSIAGLTETFNPERSWQGFSKQRKGDTTDYSLEQGLDTYIHGALDWIYHIEDIQKRRALENHIRYIHSEEGVKARVDAINQSEELDADEAQRQIDAVYAEANNPLNNFVTNLRAGTNTLANKKSENDRQMESDTNRKIYSVMTNLNNRINANMVVGSFSSALTNFIPITQSWMEVSPVYSLRGMKDTIKSTIRDDGIVNKSDFLTNRLLNEENLYQTTWDKISDKAAIMMEAIDNFTSQTVWRSKYLQNISEGMSETEAIKNADQFAENVIAGRSRGNQPTIFDAKNPITKIFTAFQLEVNNQYGYMFKDVPQDSKNKARLIKGYATAFLGAYAYNALYSSLVGRDAAFDPISILEDLFRDMGLFGDDDEEEEPEDIILNLTGNILEEVPFVGGLMGGGRIPISSALPYSGEYGGLDALLTDVSEGNAEGITKEMLKPLYYLALPFGGGQIKKTVEGLGMFSDDHPVAGSYTDSGNLRFPVDDTFGNRLQAGLFGQYASENARDYFDNGRSPLKEKQIQEFIDVDIPIRDYWEYREGLADQKTIEDKFDYIAGLDLPVSKKNILINNIVDREEDVDLEGYEDFSSYDEFDFATKNPGKYAVSQAVGGYDSYVSYMDALGDITADKDEDGKSISGSRKEKVVNYIESLDIDYGMKIILFKSMYDSKEDRNTYNADIVEYLDSRDDISYEEMVTILTELGMRVEGNNVYWD